MENIAFYILGGMAVVTALLMVTRRNPITSALWLAACFFAFAGLFITLSAHFIGVIQVLLYAGAIMVLFVFVIMLLNLGPDELKARVLRFPVLLGGAVTLYLFVLLLLTLLKPVEGAGFSEMTADYGNVAPIGRLLFTKYLVPFEMTSILLLIAIVGSVVMAKRKL